MFVIRPGLQPLLICLFFLVSVTALAEKVQDDKEFDHFTTGFPITGLHSQVVCAGCHIKGVFKGTPQTCAGCHNGQVAPGKSGRHVASDNQCDNCHSTFSWNTVAIDHASVIGSCHHCHDGALSIGKPVAHVQTTAECDACHGTIGFIPVRFDHDAVVGNCSSPGCHINDKSADHIPTNQGCGNCHSTVAWTPASNHNDAAGKCSTAGCHAKDKPAKHVTTNAECDACHTTVAWVPANIDHSSFVGNCNSAGCHSLPSKHIQVACGCDNCHRTNSWIPFVVDHDCVVGSCQVCHNGVDATGKPANHILTTQDCDVCHRATQWTPVLNFSHTSSSFPGQHNADVTCDRCHVSNSELANWRSPIYKPDCAGCHEQNYVRNSHLKSESPSVYYEVVDLKDCANTACHLYNEGTTEYVPGNIKETRVGHHKVGNGGW